MKHFRSQTTLTNEYTSLASNISASTLQHTSPRYTFPKGSRFKQPTYKTSTNLQIPPLMSHRYTSQGIGDRPKFQHQYQLIQSRLNPSPDTYSLGSTLSKMRKSFGSPWKIDEHRYLEHNNYLPDDECAKLPGPGAYDVRKALAQDRYKYSLKGKGKMFNDLHLDVGPPPGAYHLNEHWVQSNRFEVITQGIGAKKDPFASKSKTPGPGRYQIPSKFDLIVARRRK